MINIVQQILDTSLNHFRNNCPENITDLVFEEIKKNHYAEYERELTTCTIQTLNQKIGKFIKVYWDLENTGRNYDPESDLIKSYTEHSN